MRLLPLPKSVGPRNDVLNEGAYWNHLANTMDHHSTGNSVTRSNNQQLALVARTDKNLPYFDAPTYTCTLEACMLAVCVSAHISDREKAWKLEFSEWTTRYIVDWKTQYDLYVSRQQQGGDGCPPSR